MPCRSVRRVKHAVPSDYLLRPSGRQTDALNVSIKQNSRSAATECPATDEDESWLRELSTPSQRRNAASSSDDLENAEWFEELTTCHRGISCPPTALLVIPKIPAASLIREHHGFPVCMVVPPILLPPCLTRCFQDVPGIGLRQPWKRALQDPCERFGPHMLHQPVGSIRLTNAVPPARPPVQDVTQKRRRFDRTCLPDAVCRLPRTQELLDSLAADLHMEVDLPPINAMAGAVLAHAIAAIQRQLQPGPAVFKIGLTTNPLHRWHNETYGYRHMADKFQKMTILMASALGLVAALLEAALIDRFATTPGCRNIAKGGEGVRDTIGPFFTYVVIRVLS